MRVVLAACLTIGAGVIGIATARAADPYWQTHHEAKWEDRSAFKEAEHQKPEWLQEHCVREWGGREVCRR